MPNTRLTFTLILNDEDIEQRELIEGHRNLAPGHARQEFWRRRALIGHRILKDDPEGSLSTPRVDAVAARLEKVTDDLEVAVATLKGPSQGSESVGIAGFSAPSGA